MSALPWYAQAVAAIAEVFALAVVRAEVRAWGER